MPVRTVAVEVLAELGVVLADPRYRLADSARHTGSRALGGRRGPPIATAEPDRARQLAHQEVALGLGLRLPQVVLEGARLLDVVFDLCEAAAVGRLGPLVEQLARVPEVPSRGPVSAPTRSSTCNSRPGSARSCARCRMPLRSRTRTVRPSKTTDQ